MRNVVLVLCLVSACASAEPTTSPAIGEHAAGAYELINSNWGERYYAYCDTEPACAMQAVRLLHQFIEAGAPSDAWICRQTPLAVNGAVCMTQERVWRTYVTDCKAIDAKVWSCRFGLHEDGRKVDLGDVRIENAVLRFNFWDGAVGVGLMSTHTFDYVPAERTLKLPSR